MIIKGKNIFILVSLLAVSSVLFAQKNTQNTESSFGNASQSVQKQLEQSVNELNKLREQIAEEKIPLTKKLSDLENELVGIRQKYQQTSRLLDSRTLDLSNLRSEIKSRNEESSYLSNLFGEYNRNFESRLHIAEIHRYRKPIDTAKLAPENSNLSKQEIYKLQAELISVSLERLMDALGGTVFEGSAVNSGGLVKEGKFVLTGPIAIFHSKDSNDIGTVEQRIGSLEPTIVAFGSPIDSEAAAKVIANSSGMLPLDPTLGSAHKIEETKETLIEHIKKGGPVMYPIFVLAFIALAVALYKWVSLAFLRKPPQKKVNALLDAVIKHDKKAAQGIVKSIPGPVGKMLAAGVEHIEEPSDLIEEVMFETVLATRLKLNHLLPFIALTSSSAPLLGLLGTVTGIMNTFTLMTVFGSGDVKMLSSGISEALITTEYGLYVAIPSLLLYAFLSRKARSVADQMEKAAVTFINQINKSPFNKNYNVDLLEIPTQDQVQNLLRKTGLRENAATIKPVRQYSEDSAGSLMDTRMAIAGKTDTVSEAVAKLRTAKIDDDVDAIFIVDENGKYIGHVMVRHLLTKPENAAVESLVDNKKLFVRVDTHKNEIRNLFNKHNIINMPVLDHEDQLVGRIARNGNGDSK